MFFEETRKSSKNAAIIDREQASSVDLDDLTPSQAVPIAGRSYDHIHKAMKSGALRATQAYPHAPWQIARTDLETWMRQGRPARPIPLNSDADSRVAS